MTKKNLIFLAIAMIISSCGMPAAAPPTPTSPPPPTVVPPTQPADVPLPTVTPVCISPEPTQKDIDRALSFADTAFDELEWERSYAVVENRVSVTWLNNPSGAVAYLEALVLPCGYEEPDLNNYYEGNWETIFQNYESYNLVNECKRNDGLRLYEFETENQGFKYGIKYWIKNDTDTRVISIMIVFPSELDAMMGDYSTRLFPTYPSCP